MGAISRPNTGKLDCYPAPDLSAVAGADLFHLALFGVSNTGIALTLFMIGARMLPAAQTALIGVLDAPLSPIWVWLAFGEVPTDATIIGGCLVMAAVLGHILYEQRRIHAA